MAASHWKEGVKYRCMGVYLQRLPFSRYNLQRSTDLLYTRGWRGSVVNWHGRIIFDRVLIRPRFTPKAFVYLVNPLPPLNGLPLRNNLGEQQSARVFSTRLGYDLRERHAGILVDLCYGRFRNCVVECFSKNRDFILITVDLNFNNRTLTRVFNRSWNNDCFEKV